MRNAGQAIPLPTSHPIGFWFFFWGEFAERCSYYGMRAILLLYMIDRLHFADGTASAVMNYFMAAAYFLPLVGGYVADNFFGKYRTIVGFSVPYILGHVILGFENVVFLTIALALLAMGAGVIKPNVSTLMGMTYDQQRPGQTKLRSDAFAWFYVAINSGAFISSFCMPGIRNQFGYRIAFLFPAALMAFSFLIFALGKPFYAVETVRRARLTPQERHQRWLVLRRILGLFVVIIFFWSVLEQNASTWTLFARDRLDLNVFDYAPGTWGWKVLVVLRDYLHINLIGAQLPADQFQALNPVLVILLVPPITMLWHLLARCGLKLRPTDKMFIGFLLTCFTPLILSIGGYRAEELGRVSILWLVVPYVIVTIAEVCISVTALELAFTAAPGSMTSFVTACWLLTLFGGDFLNSFVTPYYESTINLAGISLHLSAGRYFALFTAGMVPVTIAFLLAARRFNRSADLHAA
jgi:dipeptide/tripeptide permease